MRNPRHRNGTSAGDHASEPANYGFTPQMLIWAALWADRLEGASFRRQKPIGPIHRRFRL
jgi:hypothetical protein